MAKQFLLQTFALTIVLASSFRSTKAQNPFVNCGKNEPKHSSLTNIDKALTQLTSMASTSYFNTTTSNTTGSTSGHQDQVYALFSCRYDASLEECHSCVALAAATITQACPNSSDAIMYYPLNCTLHYANHSIFSYVEDKTKYTESRNELVNDNGQFRQVLSNTVSSLISNVTSGFNASSRYFGTTTAEYLSRSHKMIYALAQCNPDITPFNCSNCLQNDFDSYISLHPGQVPVAGQMFSPSCMLGYKLSDKEQSPPWDFLLSSTGARGSLLYGSYMASISIVVLSLMLLRM